MKNIIKILSVCLLGLIVLLSSCEKNYPFPDAEKVTFISLRHTGGPGAWDEPMPPSTQLTFRAEFNKFGGTKFSKIQICVVKNPDAVDYVQAVLTELTSLPTEGQTLTFTIQQLLDATGTAKLEAGDDYNIYYNIEMPDGAKSLGWTKLTGFASFRINEVPGATQRVKFDIICNILTINEFLGDWIYTTTWNPGAMGSGATFTAVEDPDNLGKGIILTMVPGTEGTGIYWDFPLKIGLNLEVYTWSSARQQISSETLNPALLHTAFWTANAANINTCLYPNLVISIVSDIRDLTGLGWAASTHVFTKQ